MCRLSTRVHVCLCSLHTRLPCIMFPAVTLNVSLNEQMPGGPSFFSVHHCRCIEERKRRKGFCSLAAHTANMSRGSVVCRPVQLQLVEKDPYLCFCYFSFFAMVLFVSTISQKTFYPFKWKFLFYASVTDFSNIWLGHTDIFCQLKMWGSWQKFTWARFENTSHIGIISMVPHLP